MNALFIHLIYKYFIQLVDSKKCVNRAIENGKDVMDAV